MRLSSFLPPTLVGLLVLGCAGDPAGPSARPISANADIAFSDRTQLIETFAYSFCADEFIPLTGTSHEVFSFNETAAGVVHVRLHFKIHAVGVSPTTGESMVINLMDTLIFPDFDSFFEGTDESTWALVTKGGAPNEVVRYKYHLTINANGTVTSSFEDFTISC
jgi:hypothetical protein